MADLSLTQKEAAMVARALANIRLNAPRTAWYLVAERLAPIGLTCWLGIE